MEKTTLEFTVGPGGWLHVGIRSEQGTLERFLAVRLRPDNKGRWELEGTLFLTGLSAESIRTVPLRRILLAVEASESLREKLAARLEERAPDPGTIEFMQSGSGFLIPEPPPVKIERPKGRNLSDDFYATVGDAYRVAVERGEAPRTTIAESAGVSNEVAGRWVRQARKRGYLPVTEPGKVSA
jgi:hypothetical protein